MTRKLTEQDVYQYFLGDVVIGLLYNSPIPGRQDGTPSFKLFEHDDRILWIDFGLTNQYGNKVENLVQYLKGLPLTAKGYYDAQRIIMREVKMNYVGKPLTSLRKVSRDSDDTPQLVTRDFLPFELDYWDRFGITKSRLIYEDITPVSELRWESGKTVPLSVPGDPAFAYWWSRNPASYKLYRPLAAKRDKFRQFNIEGIIEGWNTFVKESSKGKVETLLIVSSTKDRLVVKEVMGEGYSSINPRGESDRSDIVNKRDEILSRAKRVVILYDADDPGYIGSMTLSELTGFEAYDMRGKLDGQKDFSDYVDTEKGNHTYHELRNIILNTITQ